MILAALITLLVVIWLTDAAYERADARRRFDIYLKTPGELLYGKPDAWLQCMRAQREVQDEIMRGYRIRPRSVTVEFDVEAEVRFEFE